ncbi:epoxide hydrolase, soluble (sEH) [Cadophora gregata]|uniref:epoxide hydrolase, soluble (sEH) n=1 Tax=Cadophora gregata TaxID=51156 RepID=UPI0026DCC8C9|nr:epoxide hydrolase, soluble (sEH) [Cadophora gregata]KAK0102921.1 epoxide hydrolase, soluble (sEH) [Cadophora gregata f. sp. sojae]KAK0128942.1 epoxide hydrolase, soluble (sEH) [Cadophora gregata]
MPPLSDADPIDSSYDGFSLLQHGHKDMVQATAFNAYGDRFASSSVDGKIKVYNRHKDGTWNLCDTWGAHTAEILQIQWLPPTIHPHLIASIGTDGRFKLWVEDPTLPPSKGRRFNSHSNKPVYELRSQSRAPYLSFAITHNPETRHTYLALIDRNAVLTVYENDEPENLESWNDLDRVNVCEKPARGEEVSFKVAFDPNLEPCYMGIRQGVARDALGVIVASMNRASIWRTKEISHNVSLGSSTTKEFYLAAELKGHKGLVRDVAWAPGNIRGFDIVATACKDGFIRVFQVTTPGKGGRSSTSSLLRSRDFSKTPEKVVVQQRSAENGSGSRVTPSGIGAGLQYTRPRNPDGAQVREGEVLHVAKEVSRLEANRNPVWRVEFDADGQLLGSTGDDGKLMLWRREPSGVWSKSSELAMTRTAVS